MDKCYAENSVVHRPKYLPAETPSVVHIASAHHRLLLQIVFKQSRHATIHCARQLESGGDDTAEFRLIAHSKGPCESSQVRFLLLERNTHAAWTRDGPPSERTLFWFG